MPNPATHLIVPLVLADIWRDYFAKKRFPLFYVLAAGIAGLFPDIDIAIWWVLNLLYEVPKELVHRQFTHSIFMPLLFVLIAMLWRKNRKALLLFSMIGFGIFTHLLLDAIFSGSIMPFYPFADYKLGLDLVSRISANVPTLLAVFDGVLLGGWLIHEYAKHRIKDFI